MGLNTLSAATDGQVIPAAHHNELVTALGGDFVPRNPSRVPEDIIGQLGTSALRWLRAYVQTYHIGTASSNLIIYEGAAGELWIQRNDISKESLRIKDGLIEMYVAGVKKFDVTSSGINWVTQANRSIPFEKLNYTTINVAQTNSNAALLYTTTALSIMFFIPIGSRMEDDLPVGIYVDSYFIDSDGGEAHLYLYHSRATTSSFLGLNASLTTTAADAPNTNSMVLVPSGKNIRALVTDSSDKIGGTLYVFPLG